MAYRAIVVIYELAIEKMINGANITKNNINYIIYHAQKSIKGLRP